MDTISVKKAKEMIDQGHIQIIDVRTPEEFAGGHIESAVNIDIHSPAFEESIKKLGMDKHYVVNCQGGGRSATATAYMQKLGFKNAMNLEGGIAAWKKEGFSVEK